MTIADPSDVTVSASPAIYGPGDKVSYGPSDEGPLYPGDRVEMVFRARTTNAWMLGTAVDAAWQSLMEEGHVDWTGYRVVDNYNDPVTSEVYTAVIFEGTVKAQAAIDQAQIDAGRMSLAMVPPVVLLATLGALVLAAAIWLLEYHHSNVVRANAVQGALAIANDPNQPAEVRAAALGAAGQAAGAGGATVGEGLKGIGGGMVALAVVALLFLLLPKKGTHD